MPTSVDIQNRCRAVAERFEALAGRARVDVVVSADLLLEAASLLRGYNQCLLVEQVLGTPESGRATKAILGTLQTELDRQKRDGVGVFDRRFDDVF